MWSKIKSLLTSDTSRPSVPARQIVYAIGDIHGYLGLLDDLLAKIEDDARAYPNFHKTLVFLGDYVDRGPASKGVVERLSGLHLADFDLVFISGNHEVMMLTFLEDVSIGEAWLRNGGRETMQSYGVLSDMEDVATIQQAFIAAFPRHHRVFLQGLDLCHVVGDYFFVHAGIRPGRPIDRQAREDMVWIREPFLTSERDHGKVVVHGHSINYEPEFYPDDMHPRRIGIDTGAYKSGVLTCLALKGEERSLIQTGQPQDDQAQAKKSRGS
jgi:serine/threonine protein phosphatase 1